MKKKPKGQSCNSSPSKWENIVQEVRQSVSEITIIEYLVLEMLLEISVVLNLPINVPWDCDTKIPLGFSPSRGIHLRLRCCSHVYPGTSFGEVHTL
jgi:hypothetical protein